MGKKKNKARRSALGFKPSEMRVFDMLAPVRALTIGVLIGFFLGLPAVGWLIKALGAVVNFLEFLGELFS